MCSMGCGSRVLSFAILFFGLSSVAVAAVKPHPSVRVSQVVCKMDITLEVGQYIQILDKGPIRVFQYGVDNPYRTYRGCKVFNVHANFHAMMFVRAVGVAEGGGEWRAEIGPEKYVGGWLDQHVVDQGVNVVKICVQGEEVDISRFNPVPGMRIAEVRVSLMPI